MNGTSTYTPQELSAIGKARCGCVYHAEEGIPCQHDLSALASVLRKFKRSFSVLPMDDYQLELLDAAANRVTYEEAVRIIRQNIALKQQLPHIVRRMRESMAAMKKLDEDWNRLIGE